MIESLKPEILWSYFNEITKIPRPSKHEQKVAAYLKNFAEQHSLRWYEDSSSNIVIYKEAVGKSNAPAVILQSHMDMVCEKEDGFEFDFLRDPIPAYIDGEWIRSKGTTLGADCGIGMAISLALLASEDISHPPLEVLFTVDEEIGLVGASNLEQNILRGKYLINLDSEDEGEIFIGCAGGIDTLAIFDYDSYPIEGREVLRVQIMGLVGGHSGDDINRNRANANLLLCRALHGAMKRWEIKLVAIDGGNLRNAIPRTAYAEIAVKESDIKELESYFNEFIELVKNEYHKSEPNLNLEVTRAENAQTVICDSVAKDIISAVLTCANGVMAMSQDIDGFVETSTSLASIKQSDCQIVIVTNQRSSIESKKTYVWQMIAENFLKYGAKVVHANEYPGWEPAISSHLVEVCESSYYDLFGSKAQVKAVHAGLECGLILKKYPHLEMVSIGPTIKQVHSPKEMLSIKSTQQFWQFIIKILKTLNNDE